MTVRRILGFSTVFFLGIVLGGLAIRASFVRPVSATEAQHRALLVLNQTPVAMGIGDNHIVEAVKRIEPAVVNIDTVGRARTERADEDGVSSVVTDQEVRGKGSGVVITADGYIITNNHVIDGANRIRVTLPDGRWYYANLVGRDPQNDLAVVRINVSNLPTATLGDSDSLQVGEWSIAVGNPLGLGSTVTVGVISALNRRNLQVDEGRNLDGAIQTDASINRGNSGGALANINGQLIGINTAILSSGPNGGSIGLGFAIPSNTVRRVAHDLIANGHTLPTVTHQPWLGIAFAAVPEEIGQSLGLPAYRGVLVRHVLPESPASVAGLEDGDILLSVNGRTIGMEEDVRAAVTQRKIGQKVEVHFLRPNEHREHTLDITLQARPDTLTP